MKLISRIVVWGKAHPWSVQAGQSLVELALALPVIMFMILGAADLGRMFNAHVTITGAAHKGAIFGSSSASSAANSAGIQSAALADTTTLAGSPPTVTSAVAADPYGYQQLTVTVSYTFRPLFPYPGLPSSFALSRTALMRVKP